MEEEHLVEIWVTLKDFIVTKQREEAAFQFVKLIEESGMVENLRMLSDHDVYLDKAIAEQVDIDEDLCDELEFEDY